jgi:acetyltransferase-like isoleucine patch superfamily enzyme
MEFKKFALRMKDIFSSDTSVELREQILRYQMSSMLSDVERAKLFGLPKNCRIREGAKIISPENLLCGESVWIGENAILDASGGLEIGAHTSIGLSVFIWSHTSHKVNRAFDNVRGSSKIKRTNTKIGNGCFIAGPSVILPGISVGDKAIIGPLSVVDRDIEESEVFANGSRLNELEKEISKLKVIVDKFNKK